MIAVDTQILVYAHRREMPFHARAVEAMKSLVVSRQTWAVPWPCIHEFLATVSRPRYFQPPSTIADGFLALDRLNINQNLRLLAEGADHYARLRDLLEASRVSGPAVHDARIAAICLSHGVRELWTVDRDFSRFPTLKTRNPLVP